MKNRRESNQIAQNKGDTNIYVEFQPLLWLPYLKLPPNKIYYNLIRISQVKDCICILKHMTPILFIGPIQQAT